MPTLRPEVVLPILALVVNAPACRALRVQHEAQPTPGLHPVPLPGKMLRPGVLHFMFELKDSLQHPGIWGKFFSQAMPGTYKAWAHCTDHLACENDFMMKEVGVRLVPTVYSQRGADLVNPFVSMIRLALDEGEDLVKAGIMEKFILLSDATLPVKPFTHVHWDQTSREDSDVCFGHPNQWSKTTIEGVPYALVKHHQWVSLNRHDAKNLADDWQPVHLMRFWNLTLKSGRFTDHPTTVPRLKFPGGAWFTATDEEAIYERAVGLLELKDLNDMEPMWKLFHSRRCTTYVDWDHTVPYSQLKSHMVKTSLLQKWLPWGKPDPEPPRDFINATHEVTLPLLNDMGTKFSIQRAGVMHPFTIEELSLTGLNVLRQSRYLFARKFSNYAHLPNYTGIMFADS